MSVLACDRRGCENIMCQRLSRQFGYICWECFEELVELGITANIAVFMGTPKMPRVEPVDVESLARKRCASEFPMYR